MTSEELAHCVAIEWWGDDDYPQPEDFKDLQARVAEAIRQAIQEEREACARECREIGEKAAENGQTPYSTSAFHCATAIECRK